jgi:hypothetical protein
LGKSKSARPGNQPKTLELFQAGHTVYDIASMLDRAPTTIFTHLEKAIQEGTDLDLKRLVPLPVPREISRFFESQNSVGLGVVFEAFEGRYTYNELRIYRAMLGCVPSQNR